jgi:hypothetical protein
VAGLVRLWTSSANREEAASSLRVCPLPGFTRFYAEAHQLALDYVFLAPKFSRIQLLNSL